MQSVRQEKFTAIIRFNEKGGENMKTVNPLLLPTALAAKMEEIQYAKVLNDGNLLVRCNSEEQSDKASKLKEKQGGQQQQQQEGGAQHGGGCKGVMTGAYECGDGGAEEEEERWKGKGSTKAENSSRGSENRK